MKTTLVYGSKESRATKRVRHVYPEPMVAHIWANRSQDEARNQRNTFFFADSTIYSYGSHFPIARHVTVGKGKDTRKCVFFTTQENSVTTSRHKSTVQSAIRGDANVFYVPRLYSVRGKDGKWELQHKSNLESYAQRIRDTARKALRARANKGYLIDYVGDLISEGNRYIAFFKLRAKPFVAPTKVTLKAMDAAELRAAELNVKKEAKAKAAHIKKVMEEYLPRWLSGVNCSTHPLQCLPKTYLRVRDGISNDNGDGIAEQILETSRGAEVPLRHAIRILPLIRSGKEYKRNGHTEHVGHFALDSIDAAGNVKIGCHSVERDEIERIAAQLGL